MGTVVRPARRSPGSSDTCADVDLFRGRSAGRPYSHNREWNFRATTGAEAVDPADVRNAVNGGVGGSQGEAAQFAANAVIELARCRTT
jgi:hypothetical protein